MSTLQDALAGIEFDGGLEGEYLVSDAVVLLRLVHQETGRESFLMRNSIGMSGIAQLGLIHSARLIVDVPGYDAGGPE